MVGIFRRVFSIVSFIFLMASFAYATYNAGYDVRGLVAISENSYSICERLKYEDLKELEDIVKEIKGVRDPLKALYLSSTIGDLAVSYLRRLELKRNSLNKLKVEGVSSRIEYYALILGDRELVIEARNARKAFERGDLNASLETLEIANSLLLKKIADLPVLTPQSDPLARIKFLETKYNATLHYAIQVAIALPENGSKDVNNEVYYIQELLDDVATLEGEGRYLEALTELEENVERMINFQRKLNYLEESTLRSLFDKEGKMLVLRLKIALKKYEKTTSEGILVEIANNELELAKVDMSLGRNETAYLRVLRASRIIGYLYRTREE
ncbi:hypothetical protein [Pyrococcus sp. ST04]|uniref:hypothetical protein n=1 Tax=Pyrococcus sp. ST04 TaxID=1183377 RepID=UPI0002605E55|nr:hypothetical protein [Pyrococcus sp. ST04]AFK22568.1 hypothetical protein Py04_0986 [Pyrococcus sp. ST04]